MKKIRLANSARALALFVAITAVIFALVEGVASLTLVGRRISFTTGAGLRSRIHVEYDSLLGWVNVPGTSFPDMYGRGKHLTINRQSLRNDLDMTPDAGSGRIRVLCVGDSFTLGIGVENRHTWCSKLEALDERIESFNFGEAGYGVGQAYLKYKRHTADVEYDAVVFAFINHDFARMQTERFGLLYPKPRMRLVDDRLTTDNVPVPRLSWVQKWLAKNSNAFQELRSVTLAGAITSSIFGRSAPGNLETDGGQTLGLSILKAVAEEAASKNAAALFVYLPDRAQATLRSHEVWSTYLEPELDSHRLPWLDLVAEVRGLPFKQRDSMYDPEWRHYTEAGNAYVARKIYRALQGILGEASLGAGDSQVR